MLECGLTLLTGPGEIIVSNMQACCRPASRPLARSGRQGLRTPALHWRYAINPNRRHPASGEQMASSAASYNPTRDDFAAMLDESFAGGNLQESSVIKGMVVAIEKDMAVIDVGLKTEGRVALREFAGPGRESELNVGDEVEVFLDRIENALGEAVCRATRRAARKAGASSRRRSTTTRRSTASFSTRSRAASRSISTARLRSCRARRSTSVRSATSAR